MKDEYDDFDDNQEAQHMGLGSKKRGMSRNQQIYGDFYEAYEQEPKITTKPKPVRFAKSAYSNFKSGSTIQNYAGECDVHIPEPKPKKKVKTITQEEEEQEPEVGQFNLQSFLREYQEKEDLQKIEEQQQEESYNGPYCLHSKVKTTLNLVKIGEDDDGEFQQNGMNLNEMTFEQYQKLVMRNGKKEAENSSKKLTKEEREKQKEFIEGYGKGYKMLQKMGFNLSKGLGKQQKGMTKPVEAVFKTAFTTKDSELKQQQEKEQQEETQQQQMAAEQALFQYRSKNTRINNFLLDLKNKFQSINSKMYFYEREIQSYDRDDQINSSLKLQKQNQIQQHEEEIKKLSVIHEYGRERHAAQGNNYHKQQVNLRNIYPRLALKYKMDVLFVKNQLLRLKAMKEPQLYDSFPDIMRQTNRFLNNFYLEKERETIKGYQQGFKSFKDPNCKVWNLEEDVIDLVDEGPTEEESVASVSIEDQQQIVRMIQLIAEKTVVVKINEVLATCKQIGDIKNFKLLECLRALKQLNKTSDIVHNIIKTRIRPLILKYYEHFQIQQVITDKKSQKKQQKATQNSQLLPHLVIFPLFEIMDPAQMQFEKLLTRLSKKLWNLKSPTLYNILRPILEYCPLRQRQHFINFYLSPRLLYHLEEFDLTQPHISKELISSLKLYKQFLSTDVLKQLVNSTIVPEIVMTYRKYEEEGTRKEDLVEWTRRWVKEIGKIVPQYLEEVLLNDFNISL